VLRSLRPLVPLPFLLAIAAWSSARVAERAGEAGAAVLSTLAAFARQAEPAATELPIPTGVLPVSDPVASESAAPALAGPASKNPKKHGSARATAPAVLFVSRDQVLRLATARVVPRGTPVAASGLRPAGLRLSGVAALGIGLQDGDVLTRALGVPALSSGAVVQAVLVARAHRAPVLDGEVWRGNQRLILRVEQPYLAESDVAPAPVTAAPARLTRG
jgi:hypothetical protein